MAGRRHPIQDRAQHADRLVAQGDLIGPIVRVQVQTEPLKRGERGSRWYDPTPIAEVAGLRLEPVGVRNLGGNGGDALLDVHHRDHARSRYRGENGVSLGFTSHYDRMRAAFGRHLTDGVAEENILVASDRDWTETDLAGGVAIETAGGFVRLDHIIVAKPCVEFSMFCLGLAVGARPDRRVTAALQALDNGVRGFYATWNPNGGDPAPLIRPGDRVYRLESSVTPSR